MTDLMDRRLAARRRRVREDGARRRLRWLLAILLVAALGGFVVWLFQSPLLSIRGVAVSGADRSATAAILSAQGVTRGVPTIGIRSSRVEDALRDDPWIADARVTVTWPGSVEVVVREYQPVAWVPSTEGWVVVAAGGAVLERAPQPDGMLPVVDIQVADIRPGTDLDDVAVLGACEFVAALPDSIREGLRLHLEGEELVADVPGIEIRLGRPIDMAQKAASVTAMVRSGVETGSVIDVLSPTRPAVVPPAPGESEPQPSAEGEGEGTGEPLPSG